MRSPMDYPWHEPPAMRRGPGSVADWKRVFRHCRRRALAWLLVALKEETTTSNSLPGTTESYAYAASENWAKVGGHALYMAELFRLHGQ